MSRFLMVDIGAGTMDVLWYDTQTDLHYKAVVKSPVRYLAEKAAELPGDLVITGSEMGGGPITQILKQRAKEAEVVMSASAAATLHHNPETVRSWGIKILDDEKAGTICGDNKYSSLVLADLDGDGDIDVLLGRRWDNTRTVPSPRTADGSEIAWHENTDGQGNFGPRQLITSRAVGASDVYPADLDGDGDIDAVVLNSREMVNDELAGIPILSTW